MTKQSRDWNESIVRELRRLAEAALHGERRDHTLQPTALVNEAFLILNGQHNIDCDKSQFFAAAATTIRRILVDHARRRNAVKRGGNKKRVPLQVTWTGNEQTIDVLALHEALDALAKESSRAARVVELRFFTGLTTAEIAEMLGVSVRTVNNDWSFSKAWLYRKMSQEVL